MNIELIMWLLFWFFVTFALFVDLAILNKYKDNTKTRNVVIIVCAWVSLALFFGLIVYIALGYEKSLEYITSYVIEYSLSMDNMFVFLMIFKYFNILKNNQFKVLFYGIIGAIILRFFFVFVGVHFINAFSWTTYIFGSILIYASIKMIFRKNKKYSPENSIAYKFLKKFLPFSSNFKTSKFFIKQNSVLYATPMFAAVFVIEMSDIVFAVDSIPAVLSISRDTFIIYTSNIFAIIGLRALYFLLSNLSAKFQLLQIGIAIILLFVGFKMIISHFINIPTVLSLGIVVIVLFTSIIASQIYNKCK
jgi:tellurite resistance protein TerC